MPIIGHIPLGCCQHIKYFLKCMSLIKIYSSVENVTLL
jgi:hypothetical protein